jgi:hypothetical protein
MVVQKRRIREGFVFPDPPIEGFVWFNLVLRACRFRCRGIAGARSSRSGRAPEWPSITPLEKNMHDHVYTIARDHIMPAKFVWAPSNQFGLTITNFDQDTYDLL